MFEPPISLLWPLIAWMASLSTGAKWAYGSAFIVLLGVIGETIADLTSWIKDDSTRKIVERASALILILGLAGDLVSVRMGQIEASSLELETSEAKREAAEAKDRASANEKLTAQLRIDLETAKGDTKTAQTRLEREQRKTADAQKEAAQALLSLKKNMSRPVAWIVPSS